MTRPSGRDELGAARISPGWVGVPAGDGVGMALFGGLSLVLLVAGMAAVIVNARNPVVFGSIAVEWTQVALLACAAALSLSVRSPDLSLAGVAAVSGLVYAGFGGLPGLLAGAVVAAALGAANGALAGLLRLHPAICTLASGVVLVVGATAVAEDGRRVTAGLPTPVPALILVLVFFVAAATDGVTLFARPRPRLPDAVHRFLAHVLAGVLAGLSGAVGVAHLGVVSPSSSSFTVEPVLVGLAAAVMGGTSAAGGRRSLLGAVLAAGFLATTYFLAVLLGASTLLVSLLTGVLLVLALGGDRLYDTLRHRQPPRSVGYDATTLEAETSERPE